MDESIWQSIQEEDCRCVCVCIHIIKLFGFQFFCYSWYVSKDNLAKQGRSQVQQKYIDISSDGLGKILWERFLSVCRNIPVADNFYLSLWFRGVRGYDPVDKPHFTAPYLTKEGFQKLKVGLQSIL